MGGRGQISCAEKCPIIHVSPVPSGKRILTPHSVSACWMCFPPSKEYPLSGRGEETSNLTKEKSDKHHLRQVIKVNVDSAK